MLEHLKLNNFHSGEDLSLLNDSSCFILKTCQRTLVLTMDPDPVHNHPLKDHSGVQTMNGREAYTFLLEIICGLKSKLVGENEIVSQFKTAYQDYNSSSQKCSKVLLVLEKLFKDSKEIRTKYLLGLSQKTYSSITRKHIVNKHQAKSVLILGSGQLAEDLINQFKKKITVYISGRNTQKIESLSQQHNLEVIPWKDFSLYAQFPFIANSIGCSNSQFIRDDFFGDWRSNHLKRLFIDLGSPSVIQTDLNLAEGVMRLDEIFNEGAVHEDHKLKQIESAKQAMSGIVHKRDLDFKKKQRNKKIYSRK